MDDPSWPDTVATQNDCDGSIICHSYTLRLCSCEWNANSLSHYQMQRESWNRNMSLWGMSLEQEQQVSNVLRKLFFFKFLYGHGLYCDFVVVKQKFASLLPVMRASLVVSLQLVGVRQTPVRTVRTEQNWTEQTPPLPPSPINRKWFVWTYCCWYWGSVARGHNPLQQLTDNCHSSVVLTSNSPTSQD